MDAKRGLVALALLGAAGGLAWLGLEGSPGSVAPSSGAPPLPASPSPAARPTGSDRTSSVAALPSAPAEPSPPLEAPPRASFGTSPSGPDRDETPARGEAEPDRGDAEPDRGDAEPRWLRPTMRAALEATWLARFPDRPLSAADTAAMTDALVRLRTARSALQALGDDPSEGGAERRRALVRAIARATADFERIGGEPIEDVTAGDTAEEGLTPEDDDRPVVHEPLPPPPPPPGEAETESEGGTVGE